MKVTIQEVTLVRIYLREGEHVLGKIMKYLRDEAKVRGATVLRGVQGFSENGTLRTTSLVDLSLDLPLVVEFYDETSKVDGIISTLVNDLRLSHVIRLPAVLHTSSVV